MNDSLADDREAECSAEPVGIPYSLQGLPRVGVRIPFCIEEDGFFIGSVRVGRVSGKVVLMNDGLADDREAECSAEPVGIPYSLQGLPRVGVRIPFCIEEDGFFIGGVRVGRVSGKVVLMNDGLADDREAECSAEPVGIPYSLQGLPRVGVRIPFCIEEDGFFIGIVRVGRVSGKVRPCLVNVVGHVISVLVT